MIEEQARASQKTEVKLEPTATIADRIWTTTLNARKTDTGSGQLTLKRPVAPLEASLNLWVTKGYVPGSAKVSSTRAPSPGGTRSSGAPCAFWVAGRFVVGEEGPDDVERGERVRAGVDDEEADQLAGLRRQRGGLVAVGLAVEDDVVGRVVQHLGDLAAGAVELALHDDVLAGGGPAGLGSTMTMPYMPSPMCMITGPRRSGT